MAPTTDHHRLMRSWPSSSVQLVWYCVCLALVAIFTYPLILNPAGLLPDHWDPRVFAWVMTSNTHRLLTAPLSLYQANAMYPHGEAIAYSESLLVPSVVHGVVYLLSKNPVLAYNVTLLGFWALSGWAMFVVARALTGANGPAALAALGFVLCPYRMEYYLEFQMQLTFVIPLMVFAWYRFLVTQRWRELGLALAMGLVTALNVLYYAIILALALAAFTLMYVLLRPTGWRWSTLWRAAAGSVGLMAVCMPFLLPYLRAHRELRFERLLEEQPLRHSADLLAYVETRQTMLYQWGIETRSETIMFMGAVVLALALLALMWWRPGSQEPDRLRRWRRLSATGCALALSLFAVYLGGGAIGLIAWSEASLIPASLCLAMLGCGLVVFWCHGRRISSDVAHASDAPVSETTTHDARELTAAEWVGVLLSLAFLFFALSLGPVVHFNRQPIGAGIYGAVYDALPFLRAIRVITRFGVIFVFSVSLLAAFGASWLLRTFSSTRRSAITAVLGMLMVTEFWGGALAYAPAPWPPPSDIYEQLAEEAGDFAILEIPLYADKADAEEMLTSTYHWKYLVNGVSGFVPAFTRQLHDRLRERPEFPTPRTLTMLRSIYPLRYIVVHNGALVTGDQIKWREAAADRTMGIHYIRTDGDSDLYRFSVGVEEGSRIERRFSYDFGRQHRRASFWVRAVGLPPGSETSTVRVLLNGTRQASVTATAEWQFVSLTLESPLRKAAANLFVIRTPDDSGAGGDGTSGAVTGPRLQVRDVALRPISGDDDAR